MYPLWTNPYTWYIRVCANTYLSQSVICNPCIINLTLWHPNILLEKISLWYPGAEKKKKIHCFIFHCAVWANRWSIYRFPHFTPTKKAVVRLMSSSRVTGRVAHRFFLSPFAWPCYKRQTNSIKQLFELGPVLTHEPYLCMFSSFQAGGINTFQVFLPTVRVNALCSVLPETGGRMGLIWSGEIIILQIGKQSLCLAETNKPCSSTSKVMLLQLSKNKKTYMQQNKSQPLLYRITGFIEHKHLHEAEFWWHMWRQM